MVEDIFGIVGTTLAGTFHVEEVIAEGGFGVVYRAEHVAFRAPVALKCLKIPGTISPTQSDAFVENFREEAEILFHLSAQIPEVVRPLHADAMTLEDGTFVPYIAMEWVEAKPLDSIIIMREEEGMEPLSLRKSLKILTPIAHALNKAHKFQVPGGAIVSVTHCDLKPENILITERDNPVRAKLLDFGIAKARDMMRQNVGRITDSEVSRPFTPSYGAPEQWVPKRYGQSGPWTDVWGLALTLVECLTGRPPIDGDMHAMMGTALDKTRRPTPTAEGATVSSAVEAVFQKALAVDPRERYQDIEEFWTALEGADNVASSFERLRKRRDRPTFDFDSNHPSPPEVGGGDLPSGEFTGLTMEGDDDLGDPIEPAAYESLEAGPGEFHVDSDAPPMPPQHYDANLDGGLDGGFESGEYDFLEGGGEAPLAEGAIDFDLRTSDPPAGEAAAVSKPRVAVTSGSWPKADATASGSHPVARTAAKPAGPLGLVPKEEVRTLGQRLRVPGILVALGLGLTILDMVVARQMGGNIALGPIKLRWVAAAMAAIGMVYAFYNLVGDKDDDE